MTRSQLGILQLALASSHSMPSEKTRSHKKKSMKESAFRDIIQKNLKDPQIARSLELIKDKDSYTYEHCLRVGELSMRLADRLGLPAHEIEEVYICGILHDIGKLHTPDSILKKPGPLTAEEFAVIRTHPVDSEKMVLELSSFSFLSDAIRGHHERYDGRGYPDKKVREDIHAYSRIILICDTFDAMTSTRIYRKEINLQSTYEEILRCAGSQFDPIMAEEFVAMHGEMSDMDQQDEAA